MINNDDVKLELWQYIDEAIKKQLNQLVQNDLEQIQSNIEKKLAIDLKSQNVVNQMFAKSKIRRLSNDVENTINNYLKDLDDIVEFKKQIVADIVKSLQEDKEKLLTQAKENVNTIVNSQKDEIKTTAYKAYELVDFIENAKSRIINEIVSEATKRFEQEDARPRVIEIQNNGQIEKTLEKGFFHTDFENIYKIVRLGLPLMLIGPTGSGKSVCAKQVAEALDLTMYYTNNASEEYKLLGFTDAHGNYKETQFYKAFKDGGLFFLDEIDNSHPSALLAINSAIGMQGSETYMAFEDGKFTKAHPNFKIIAAANTWGNGANRQYCGRSELDAASLDRFIQIYFDYDRKLERSIVSDNELLNFFWNFRRIINDLGIRHTVTTRNIAYASELKKAGFSTEQILLYTIIKELDFEDMRLIVTRFEEEKIEKDEYFDNFAKLLLKKV